jgi:hypothetical protein
MAPFKPLSKVQHITSMLWVTASHYLEEERLSDKGPENWRSAGQLPWKIQLNKVSYASLDTRPFCVANNSPKKQHCENFIKHSGAMLDKHTSLLNLLPNSLYSMEID